MGADACASACVLVDAMNNKKHRKYKGKNIRKYVLI